MTLCVFMDDKFVKVVIPEYWLFTNRFWYLQYMMYVIGDIIVY